MTYFFVFPFESTHHSFGMRKHGLLSPFSRLCLRLASIETWPYMQADI